MGEEVYINQDWMGNIEYSDTPQSIGQPKFEISDTFMPGTQEAREVGSFGIGPSFEVHTDYLGNKSIRPPSGYSVGYGGYGASMVGYKPRPKTVNDFHPASFVLTYAGWVTVALILQVPVCMFLWNVVGIHQGWIAVIPWVMPPIIYLAFLPYAHKRKAAYDASREVKPDK